MVTYEWGRVSGETAFAAICPICGSGTPVNYITRDIIVCDDCKKAVAWVKKRMEEENGQDIHAEYGGGLTMTDREVPEDLSAE